jgi:hypothetical protein
MEATQNTTQSNESDLTDFPLVYHRLLVDNQPGHVTDVDADEIRRPAPVFEPLTSLHEQGQWHTKPLLDDAFALLNENVRAAREEFQVLYSMLTPHLRLLSDDSGRAEPVTTAVVEKTTELAHDASHRREYSPTYLKVIEAAETVHAMRRNLHLIVNHLIV